MRKEQRARVDAMLPRPPADGPLPVEAPRAGFRALMDTMIVPDAVRTTQTTLGGVRALHIEPGSGARPATILYFHGGGRVFGSRETALCLTAQLVDRTGFQAYSVDYRPAPEHPFPAAIDDTLSAYRALLDTGLDPSTIAFAGDSAGGGLTVTTALAARAKDADVNVILDVTADVPHVFQSLTSTSTPGTRCGPRHHRTDTAAGIPPGARPRLRAARPHVGPSPPDPETARPLPPSPDASVDSRQLPCQSTELMRHGRVMGAARG
ncbi:alpha/beta hydrolase fold domain-containing protein [Streptomyces sp. NPDC049949]|uniref:alpha/beta hydrolase fold domain-containing protein n=1 Tax=Streptomyces sp. NPDC049949 TaxID=3154627 RepID=UPI00342A1395